MDGSQPIQNRSGEVTDAPIVVEDSQSPLSDRKAELSAACEKNITAGNAPFEGVRIASRSEVLWIVQEQQRSSGLNPTDPGRINLSGALLQEVDLTNIVLYMADLSYANLARANLTNVDLRRANLSNADMRGAR